MNENKQLLRICYFSFYDLWNKFVGWSCTYTECLVCMHAFTRLPSKTCERCPFALCMYVRGNGWV